MCQDFISFLIIYIICKCTIYIIYITKKGENQEKTETIVSVLPKRKKRIKCK